MWLKSPQQAIVVQRCKQVTDELWQQGKNSLFFRLSARGRNRAGFCEARTSGRMGACVPGGHACVRDPDAPLFDIVNRCTSAPLTGAPYRVRVTVAPRRFPCFHPVFDTMAAASFVSSH
jgi:hypothetical protein